MNGKEEGEMRKIKNASRHEERCSSYPEIAENQHQGKEN